MSPEIQFYKQHQLIYDNEDKSVDKDDLFNKLCFNNRTFTYNFKERILHIDLHFTNKFKWIVDHNIVEAQDNNTGENTAHIGFRHRTKGMIHGETVTRWTSLEWISLGLDGCLKQLRALVAFAGNTRFCSLTDMVAHNHLFHFQGNIMSFPDFQDHHQAHIQCKSINTDITYENLKN